MTDVLDPAPPPAQAVITLAPLYEAAARAREQAQQHEAAAQAARARAEAYEDAARLIAAQAAPPAEE